MCGRYVITSPLAAIREAFRLEPEAPGADMNLPSNYNVAPTHDVPIVRADDDGERTLALVRWGLVPHWAKDVSIGQRMINARSETVAEKPSFRDAFARRRCLVVADGFFEWKRVGTAKQPHFIRADADGPMAFAGLWSRWTRGEQPLETCTIITTSANEAMAPIHDRMPVILEADARAKWLSPDGYRDPSLLVPYRGDMVAFPVAKRVGNPRNNSPDLIEPLEDDRLL